MKKLIALLLFPILLPTLRAEPEKEEILRRSPDGKFQAVFTVGEDLDRPLDLLSAEDGRTLLHPVNDPDFDRTPFQPDHALWSKDSRVLAVTSSFGHSSRIRLFLWDGKTFSEIPCPSLDGDYPNADLTPSKWHKGGRLTIKVNGPMSGKANPGSWHYHGTCDIQIDLKTATARRLKQNIVDDSLTEEKDPPQIPLLEVSEIPARPPAPEGTQPAPPDLLVKASHATGDPSPSAQIVIPGNLGEGLHLGNPGPDGTQGYFLKSGDSRTLAYAASSSDDTFRSIHLIAMTSDGGLRLYTAINDAARNQILGTKLGKQLFPDGIPALRCAVTSLSGKSVTLTAPVSPPSLGGTKTLTCDLKLQSDSTVKLLDWHLSGK